jgi:aminoglycoside 3-N-acetyltransferase
MQEVNRQQILDCLHQVGVQPGDGLLVHSALQFFGRPQGGIGIYLDALQEAVGMKDDPARGTLAVPVFNFSFAKGQDYDPDLTPAVGMGAFSEFIRQQPGALRTSHPMQSFAVIGQHAAELAALDTPSAFDDGSAVDRMVQLGFNLLLLGADVQAASVLHYSEQRVGVPYRYWKEFHGQLRRQDVWQPSVYRMYVRDMEIDARLEIYEVEKELRTRGQWQAAPLNYGWISLCSLADFVRATSDLLRADPWCFVTNPPEVKK